MSNNDQRQPAREFRAGTIVASIWESSTVIDGRTVPKHDVRILKRYRDERSGQWKSTSYFRAEDLPKLALVATKVFEHVTLRVSEPAGASSVSAT